ncbi:hypothetical protein RQN30_04300 [Arcanobacterium hippocoleae]
MKRIRFAGALALSFLLAFPVGGAAVAAVPQGSQPYEQLYGTWTFPAGNQLYVYRGIPYSNAANQIELTSALDKRISDVAVSAGGSESGKNIIDFNGRNGSKVTAFQGLTFKPQTTGANNAKLTISGTAAQYSSHKDTEAAFSAYFVYKSNGNGWTPNYPNYDAGEKFPASFFKLRIRPQNMLFQPVVVPVELEQGEVTAEKIQSAVTVTLDQAALYDPKSIQFEDIKKAKEAAQITLTNSQLPGNEQAPQENSAQHNVSVTITYNDNSTENAIVKLTVNPKDSDDDGYTDYVEGLAKTNINDPKSFPAAPKIHAPVKGETLIMGEGIPTTQVTVILPNGQQKAVKVNGGGYWSYKLPAGTALDLGQTVTVSDVAGRQTSANVGKPTTVNPPVEGEDAVTGTGQPGTPLRVMIPGKELVDTVVGKDGQWSALIGRGLEIGETVIVSQPWKDPLTVTVKAKESQNVTVSVDYNVQRADGGFDPIPGTARTAVLSQPALNPDGSNLKVDASSYADKMVKDNKGLPYLFTGVEIDSKAFVDDHDNNPLTGEIDRHFAGDIVIHLIYRKGYQSGKPLTQPEKPEVTEISGTPLVQPEKPEVTEISGTPLIQPEKPKGEIGISGDPLIQPEKPKGEIGISGDPLIQPEKPKGEISVSGNPLVQPEKPVLDPDTVKAAKSAELSKTGSTAAGLLGAALALTLLGAVSLITRRKLA